VRVSSLSTLLKPRPIGCINTSLIPTLEGRVGIF
jgi:hypothetical protein